MIVLAPILEKFFVVVAIAVVAEATKWIVEAIEEGEDED